MAIEAFTAVLLQLNVRYKTRVAPKLTGIKRDPRAPTATAPPPARLGEARWPNRRSSAGASRSRCRS